MNRRSFGLFGLLTLGLVASSSVADAQRVDRDFTVVNHTGDTITHLYVSPSNQTAWGPDQLGSGVIANNASHHLLFRPTNYRGQCVFDVRVTIDGHNNDVHGVNLCTLTSITFNGEDGHISYTAR
ncbi:MAG: hypothetical protein Q8Q09_02095 [Deltaproteobacteria bacterium]|nr:hypothetical protein [Deltaproteobacteria bacterium]